MEPKCNYCDFFGEKYHCNNCKIYNKTKNRLPQEINWSLDELVKYINENNYESQLSIGDYKTIELITGEQVKIILLDVNKDLLSNGSGMARTTFGILNFDGKFEMNKQNTNEGGYDKSLMRQTYIPRFFKLLPHSLQAGIKQVIKPTSAGQGSSELIKTDDHLWLFSEKEVFGTHRYSYDGEGDNYEYFSSQQNRSFDGYKWLRSPNSGSSSSFCHVAGSGGADWSYANGSYGIALGFCI